MDDYERFNRMGTVTRDTTDYSHVPIHVRITDHPERKRLARNQDNTRIVPTKLTAEDVAEIQDLAAQGRGIDYIRTQFRLSASRTKRIIRDGDPEPIKPNGRPRKESQP